MTKATHICYRPLCKEWIKRIMKPQDIKEVEKYSISNVFSMTKNLLKREPQCIPKIKYNSSVMTYSGPKERSLRRL